MIGWLRQAEIPELKIKSTKSAESLTLNEEWEMKRELTENKIERL